MWKLLEFGKIRKKRIHTDKEMNMNFKVVMEELESLGTEFMKKRYISNGGQEPLFGVATGKMKPMSKKIGVDQELAEKLYATGNYDAMYFAGVIADAKQMTEADYNRWLDDAYFFMLSDFVVAVTLSESEIAEKVADKWIESNEDLRMSAGWSTYCWLIGSRKDTEFSEEKLSEMLDFVEDTIHSQPPHTQDAMSNFIYTVGTSFIPLHEKALTISKELSPVFIEREGKKPKEWKIYGNIQKQVEQDRIGFKRKYVRC